MTIVVTATPELIELLAAKQDQQLRAQLQEMVHVNTEQMKIVGNYHAECTRLRAENSRLRKIPGMIDIGSQARVKIGKNANRKQSAWLGLREGLLYAPLSLSETVFKPVAGALLVVAFAAIAFSTWAVGRPIVLIAGLLGRLEEKKEPAK